MLDFLRGDPRRPRGNLLLYAHTRANNPITSDSKFIVCNVVVSFAAAKEDHFPVVAFPPAILQEEEQLSVLLEFNRECDVMRLEDFTPPIYQEPKYYVRARIKNFNRVVGQYVEMCRQYFQLRVKEIHLQEGLPENSPGDLLYKFSLASYKPSSARALSSYGGLDLSGAPEESVCIDQLEQYLKIYETVPQKTHLYFHKIIKMMGDKYPHYDFANFARVTGFESKTIAKKKKPWKRLLERSRLNLATLYLRKFRAIHEEKYEEAAKIQSDIRELEAGRRKPNAQNSKFKNQG